MIPLIEHQAVIQTAHLLPPLPQSASRLLALTADDQANVAELVQVVEYDPVLTIKLLRLANSVAGGAMRRVASVRDAVIRLGTRAIVDLALAASVQPLFPSRVPGYNIAGTDFWKHSLATALATEAIPAGPNANSSAMAFTAAMLHDIGKLVLGRLLSPPILHLLECAQRKGGLDALHAEIEILDMHHGEVGGIIAQHWQLPESVVEAIIHHHQPGDDAGRICLITCLANIVAHVALEAPGAKGCLEHAIAAPGVPSCIQQSLGVTMQQCQEICQSVAARLAAVAATYEF